MTRKQEEKHEFFYSEAGRRLVCPECSQLIAPADIEMYPACPYCNTAIPQDGEIEDFSIDPLVRHWQGRTITSAMIGGR